MLGVDLERLELARATSATTSSQRRRGPACTARRRRAAADDDVLDRGASRASSTIASIGTSRPRRVEASGVTTTFASESCSRWATAGRRSPEKIGTWTAPMCAQACDATATSGDIGRKIATRSPGSTPSATSASASRVTSCESSA